MTRVKPQIQTVTIETIEQADNALKELCELSRELDLINIDTQEKVDAVKAQAQAQAMPVNQRIEVLGAALNAFCVANKKELFAKNKSKQVTFGMLGFRLSTKLKTQSKVKWDQVLGRLQDMNLSDYIRTKQEVDKEKLKTASDTVIKEAGCQLVQEDVFFYELDKENFNKLGQ